MLCADINQGLREAIRLVKLNGIFDDTVAPKVERKCGGRPCKQQSWHAQAVRQAEFVKYIRVMLG